MQVARVFEEDLCRHVTTPLGPRDFAILQIVRIVEEVPDRRRNLWYNYAVFYQARLYIKVQLNGVMLRSSDLYLVFSRK